MSCTLGNSTATHIVGAGLHFANNGHIDTVYE